MSKKTQTESQGERPGDTGSGNDIEAMIHNHTFLIQNVLGSVVSSPDGPGLMHVRKLVCHEQSGSLRCSQG